MKSQEEILEKLGIKALNPMQEEASTVISNATNTMLLSPTGTGKTVAFLLPLLNIIDRDVPEVQALIVVPSRELAIQIEQVIRTMGSGVKVNAIYGGRPISKDKIELKHTPAILIGTPGRIIDHFYAKRFSKDYIKTLILDEFDKTLEVGFEDQIHQISSELPAVTKRILTSATASAKIPAFLQIDNPACINYIENSTSAKLSIKTVITTTNEKQQTLLQLLNYIGDKNGIIFCNFKDSVDRVSNFLKEQHITHNCFCGSMDQKERERSLIQFRNGSSTLLVATELAARGIDIPKLKFIIHLELPHSAAEFTHRNGRTARINESGCAYILKWKDETLPNFIPQSTPIDISTTTVLNSPYWKTLFISGGRKDKVSKGDIAGLFLKQGGLTKEQLGIIELKHDCAFVAIPYVHANDLAQQLNNTRLKKKKVRITILP